MVQATYDGDVAPPVRRELWQIAAEEFINWRLGQPGALDRLVRLVTPVLWHLARAYHLDQQDAEDAVQNAWIALLRGADSIRDPKLVMAWMTVTTRRQAWRQSRRHHLEQPTDADVLEASLTPVDDHEAVIVNDLAAATLWRHVERLSERCQRLLRIIAFAQPPDYAGLSEQYGMPVGSIGPTRRRCLDKLRLSLADDPTWSST
jgi:RNA polymerase sigma factor (sigma-70 family)